MSEHSKITTSHRSRVAVIYVRQSTLAQLERNSESTARQYHLVERAVELGWPRSAVRVVDADLGVSGSVLGQRDGFESLVADVALGQVGIILALEVSRLARDNAAWYRLLDLAGACDTLVADADGVYHPGLFNDRLVLGMKGIMSEALSRPLDKASYPDPVVMPTRAGGLLRAIGCSRPGRHNLQTADLMLTGFARRAGSFGSGHDACVERSGEDGQQSVLGQGRCSVGGLRRRWRRTSPRVAPLGTSTNAHLGRWRRWSPTCRGWVSYRRTCRPRRVVRSRCCWPGSGTICWSSVVWPRRRRR